jgi:zinc transport system ATP-binding protein
VEHSLIISYRDHIIFTSDSHWLHPLFELNDFLQKEQFPVKELFLRDKIAGKAAACMMVYLGITKCHIELISRRAMPVFEAAGIAYSYDCAVEQIDCRTEYLIEDNMSVDDVWLFLRKRAGRVEGLPVKIENMSFSVGSRIILNGLNLELPGGEQLVVHGANGAGKTTLLKTILGLATPVSGSIKIGDFRVGSQEWMHNRMNTAYVHQENIKNTFPVSAGEVVSVGLAGVRMPASEILYNVELAMRRTGCFNLFKRSYHSLSGGEKQRVSLARCLCQHAKVLLFDEPTSFIDREGKDDLLVLLRELCYNEAPTILMVSHDTAWIEQLGWERKELKGGRLC